MPSTDITYSSLPVLKPLISDASGSTQVSRNLLPLANDYFSIEERSLTDWLAYIASFSQKLAFMDTQLLSANGSWQAAIPSTEQAQQLEAMLRGDTVDEEILTLSKRADIALLLAFFQMMKTPKNQFINFTSEHKQFYYRQVLGFKEISPVADKAHVVIKLSDNTAGKTLKKGCQFVGGEDAEGNALIYENNNNVVLNHSQVSKVLTLAKMPDVDSADKRLLLSQGYHLEQGLEYPPSGLLTFGDATIVDDTRQLLPALGFTLASQQLYLSSGERSIAISFNFIEQGVWLSDQKKITELFELRISTQDGLLTLASELSEQKDNAGITVTVNLDQFYAPISPFIDEEQPLLPMLPHIAFTLKDTAYMDDLAVDYFKSIDLAVSVKGMSGVIANHDVGALDTTKPFEPFTYAPRVASRFDFTHPELLIKNISQAELTLHWLGRPVNMAEYYQSYAQYRKQESWPKNRMEVFHSDTLAGLKTADVFSDAEPDNNIDIHSIAFIEKTAVEDSYKMDASAYGSLPLSNPQAKQWPKWFSLILSDNDLGHNDYPQVAQYIAIKNADIDSPGTTQVPQPYTPLLNKVLLNYKSESRIQLSAEDDPFQQLHHIHPLGRPKMGANSSLKMALLPKFIKWGYLYIGVAKVASPGQFRLYFQLDPVDGSNTSDAALLDWSYLDDNSWHPFSRSQGGRLESRARIIEDSTYNLLDSGVVAFELPELPLANNFMGDDLFWLRVSIEDGNRQDNISMNPKYSRIKAIFTQGLEVKLIDRGYHSSHYEQPLAAESISALLDPDPQIAEIIQPYGSYSGKAPEAPLALETRASERLKHKNRALTQWDYEHLVLAQFPELFMARCYRNDAKNDVDVMVVPVNHDPRILQPKVPLFLKRRIQRYLHTVSAPDVDVRVIDPSYEEVMFSANLNIALDYDMDGVVAELNQMLIDYMTPWNKDAANVGSNLTQQVYLTGVATELERHPAVNFVSVLRATVNGALQDNIILPSGPSAILVPVADHKITLLNKIAEVFEGVGKWRIGDDFEIS